jgi:hypothetical protein
MPGGRRQGVAADFPMRHMAGSGGQSGAADLPTRRMGRMEGYSEPGPVIEAIPGTSMCGARHTGIINGHIPGSTVLGRVRFRAGCWWRGWMTEKTALLFACVIPPGERKTGKRDVSIRPRSAASAHPPASESRLFL